MAFTARTETYVNLASLSDPYDITVTKPVGTVNGDILFCLIAWFGSSARAIDSVPSGWQLLGNYTGNADQYALYYKVASDEGASWDWSFNGSVKVRVVCSCYTGGDFNASDPIDVVSNTAYRTLDINVIAASMSVAAANSPLIFWAGVYNTTELTFTKPSIPTTDWIEDDNGGSLTSDYWSEVCSMIWSGSGATGAMSATLSFNDAQKHAFAVALKPAGQHYNRSGIASLGLVGAGTRPVACVRSDTGLLGLLATATRSWALSRGGAALLGLKATASRILTPTRAQTALLGLKATASQAVDYAAKTGTALLGLLATGSRTIALGRSKTALLGLKAIGVMSTLGHYVKEAVVYLGLAVTGTRPIVLTRVDTALLGLKATAIRTISITRLGTALLGLKATGDLIMPYIRTGTAYLGLKITASRSFALTRLDTALLGLKGIATRSLVLTRAKTALLGLKAIGKLGAPGRALKLIIVTTQNRKLNILTSLYRKIKVFTE